MALFYVVEFPYEDDEKCRGPFVINKSRVTSDCRENGKSAKSQTVLVKWDVVDSVGELQEKDYEGICLMKGTKKECSTFMDRLKANRQQADINNKEGRTRKKPPKLNDYLDLDEDSKSAKTPAFAEEHSSAKESSDSDENGTSNENNKPKKEVKIQKQNRQEKKPCAPKRKYHRILSSDSDMSDDDKTVVSVSSIGESSRKKEKKVSNIKKSRKAMSKPKKVRSVSQKVLIQENADQQSVEIEKMRQEPLIMKVQRILGNETIELQLTVNRDMTLEELKIKMSGATGIPVTELLMLVRGESCSRHPTNVKLHEIWSPQDVVGIVRTRMEIEPDKTMKTCFHDDKGKGQDDIMANCPDEGNQFPIDSQDAFNTSSSILSDYGTQLFDDDQYHVQSDNQSEKRSLLSVCETVNGPDVSALASQIKEIKHQLNKIECIVQNFVSCKHCIKAAYKNVKMPPANSQTTNQTYSFERSMTHDQPVPVDGCAKKNKSSAPESPSETGATVSFHSDDSNDEVMLGNPHHGIYVKRASLGKINSKKAKNYALKLFELLFSRDEAETSSVEGKGEKLKKLDAKRMEGLKEHTERKFPEEDINWKEVESSINSKCRMVRNGRCLLWG